MIEKTEIKTVDAERGRFRSWLLRAAKSYSLNADKRRRAVKRGGKATSVSIDGEDAERRYVAELADTFTPEQLCGRAWEYAILNDALSELAEQYEAGGKGSLFQTLIGCASGANEKPYRELAQAFGMQEGTFRQHLLRCTRRLRRIYDRAQVDGSGLRADLEKEWQALRDSLD